MKSRNKKNKACLVVLVVSVLLTAGIALWLEKRPHEFHASAVADKPEKASAAADDTTEAIPDRDPSAQESGAEDDAAAEPNQHATPHLPAAFSEARVLLMREHKDPVSQNTMREYVVKTDFVYPHVKIIEKVKQDPATGSEKLVNQKVMVADHMLVRLREGVDPSALQELNAKHGTNIRKKLLAPDTYVIGFDRIDLDILTERMDAFTKELQKVAYAEPDYIMFASATIPNDPYGSSGIYFASAHDAWDITTGSEEVIVGIVDSGIDFDHPDLASNIWQNAGELGTDGSGNDKRFNGIDDDGNGFIDDYRGWDFIYGDSDPTDEYYHGTFVGGIVGAVGNNGIGMAGMNWNVKLMPLRMISQSGAAAVNLAVDAIYYAAPFGVRVLNNSYGGSGYSQTMYDAIEFANQQGMLMVCSSGNDVTDNDVDPHYPASYSNENIIAVMGFNISTNRMWNYGAVSVDIAAYGAMVRSTTIGGGYTFSQGSSMSAPVVAGAAALLLSVAPDASNLEIRDAIFNGVDPLDSMQGYNATGGRVNAYKALQELGTHVQFEQGWNLVGFPRLDGTPSITEVLPEAGVSISQVSRLDAGSQQFDNFADSVAHDQFTTLEAHRGYWVYADTASDAFVLHSDVAIPSPVSLSAGSHLLAGPSTAMPATNWLNGLVPGVDYGSVEAYDEGTDSFMSVTDVEPGSGYKVQVLRAVSWTPPQ